MSILVTIKTVFYVSALILGIIFICIGIFPLRYVLLGLGIITVIVSIIFLIRNKNDTTTTLDAPNINYAKISSNHNGIDIYYIDVSGANQSYSATITNNCTGLVYQSNNFNTNPIFVECPLPTIYCPYSIIIKGITSDGVVTPASNSIYFPLPYPSPNQPVIDTINKDSSGLIVSFSSTDASGDNIYYGSSATDCSGVHTFIGQSTYSPISIPISNISNATPMCPYMVLVTTYNTTTGTQSFPSFPNYFPIPREFG